GTPAPTKWAGPLLCLLVTAAVASLSRGTWLGLAAAIGAVGVSWFRTRPRGKLVLRKGLIWLVVAPIVAIGFQFFVGLLPLTVARLGIQPYDAVRWQKQSEGLSLAIGHNQDVVSNPLHHGGDEKTGSLAIGHNQDVVSNQSQVAQQQEHIMDMTQDSNDLSRQLLGALGPGNYEITLHYAAHNVYIRLLAETGLPSLCLFLVSGAFALGRSLRRVKQCGRSLELALMGYLVFALVYGAFIDILHWRHFWLVLGAAVAPVRGAGSEPACPSSSTLDERFTVGDKCVNGPGPTSVL
ncbi:MAG: O-antigen ligase family protein, partial [Anaerolineae bacterium]|nr:O-antigen ligase family protein [Anaerolineae bacterium]